MRLTMLRNIWPRITVLKSIWPRITFGRRLAFNRSSYLRDRDGNLIFDRKGSVIITRPYTPAPYPPPPYSPSLNFGLSANSGYVAIIPL